MTNTNSVIELQQQRINLRAFHLMQVRKYSILLVASNFGLALAFTIGVVVWIKAAGILFFAIVAVAWWVTSQFRSKRANHLRIYLGLQQPFAEEVLCNGLVDTSYVLYLRGFEAEAAYVRYDGINVEHGTHEADLRSRPTEALIVEIFSDELPILTLNDPHDPVPMSGAHRFAANPENWLEAVTSLAKYARLTVLHVANLTPGVLAELHLLRQPDYREKSVVIVSRDFNKSKKQELQAALSGIENTVFEQCSRKWSRQLERDFQKRLYNVIQNTVENSRSSNTQISLKGFREYTLTTSTLSNRLWSVVYGPLMWSGMLLGSLIVFELNAVISFGLNSSKAWDDVREVILVWWPISIIVLVFLKGFFLVENAAFSKGKKMTNKLFN